jgi:hypothetical protein
MVVYCGTVLRHWYQMMMITGSICLQVAQSEAERESEMLTEDLLNGKLSNIDEFLDQFMVRFIDFYQARWG